MGVDLTVVVAKWETEGLPLLGYNRMTTDRDYNLYEAVNALNQRELQGVMRWYGDEGIEDMTDDAYGGKLMYVFADDLAGCFLDQCRSPWNQAVGQMLKSLPKETKIVLYWH